MNTDLCYDYANRVIQRVMYPDGTFPNMPKGKIRVSTPYTWQQPSSTITRSVPSSTITRPVAATTMTRPVAATTMTQPVPATTMTRPVAADKAPKNGEVRVHINDGVKWSEREQLAWLICYDTEPPKHRSSQEGTRWALFSQRLEDEFEVDRTPLQCRKQVICSDMLYHLNMSDDNVNSNRI